MLIIKGITRERSLSLNVFEEAGNLIVSYSMNSRQKGSAIGIRMTLITLLRYSVMMTLNVDRIYIDLEVSQYEANYIDEQIDLFITYAKVNQNIFMQRPEIIFKDKYKDPLYKNLSLDMESNFIGYSGGKDSRLCYEIIEGEFKEIKKFKIDFETEEFTHDFSERIDVIDQHVYDAVSTSAYFNNHGKNYYQEEDLHCCFAIPYFSVKDGYPGSLTIGLQFDVVNSYVYDENGNHIFEYDLQETYESIKCFEQLTHHYGLTDFKAILPLASLTSFSIYNILKTKLGEDGLRDQISCWTPNKDGSPCGKCIKCQRVSYIYDLLGMKLTEKEKGSLALIEKNKLSLDYLFGSITCRNLLRMYDGEKRNVLKSALFIDEKIGDLDWGLNKKIAEKYHLAVIQNPFKII